MERNEFNEGIIEEFRANQGKVGGGFEGAPMILVHHRGAKSGAERVAPLVYQSVGDAYAVFASKGGSPTHPHWYLNLVANPDTTVEVGADTIDVRARTAEGEERTRIWEEQKSRMPTFADYEKNAQGREIPVILLERR